MRLTRDSVGWWITTAISLLTFVIMQFDQVMEAFPTIQPIWQTRLSLFSGILATVSGFLGASPLPLSRRSKLAKRAANPDRTITSPMQMGKADTKKGKSDGD